MLAERVRCFNLMGFDLVQGKLGREQKRIGLRSSSIAWVLIAFRHVILFLLIMSLKGKTLTQILHKVLLFIIIHVQKTKGHSRTWGYDSQHLWNYDSHAEDHEIFSRKLWQFSRIGVINIFYKFWFYYNSWITIRMLVQTSEAFW